MELYWDSGTANENYYLGFKMFKNEEHLKVATQGRAGIVQRILVEALGPLL